MADVFFLVTDGMQQRQTNPEDVIKDFSPGTVFTESLNTVIATALPAEVAEQLPDVVAEQLPAVVAAAPITAVDLNAATHLRWDDLQIPDTNLRLGSTAPTLTTFISGTRLLSFAAGDEVEMSVQMPHSWAEGTTLKPHMHLSFPNANTGNYVFGLEYTLADVNGLFGATTTIESAVTAAPAAANMHVKLALPDIVMTGKHISAMIVARLYRKTGVAGAYASGIFATEFDFHYQVDAIGSVAEYTKTA